MLLFFTELCVRGTLLCLLIALALLLLRRAAATYRHLLCTLALCGLLTLPLVQELLPPLPLLKADKPADTLLPPAPPPENSGRSSQEEGSRSTTFSQDTPPSSLSSPPSLTSSRSSREEGAGGRRDLWPLAWALGAAILLLRLAVALVRLRQLAKRSQCTSLLETEILVSEHVTTPLTWGVRRPVILLPAALLTGDPAVAESALRHEKAHITRRDWLWHLLAEVVCALCWFQPGAWWLRRRLRAESERACDDRVLLSGISGPDYAAHLLEILKVGRVNSLAPGMAAVGSMEARVKHILDPKKPRRAHGLRLALTAALGLVLLPLASLKVAAKPGERPVSRLQEAVELLAPKLTFLTPSALLAQTKATLVAPKPLEPMPLAEPTLAQPSGTLAMPQPLAPPQGSPLSEPPHPDPDSTIPLDKVVWGMIVDGLEPGFLLTGVTLMEDKLGTKQIAYTALVRNRTKQPITFLVRLLQYDGYDVPFTQEDSAKIPHIERAKGVRHVGVGIDAVNLVTLAPGESVLVPGQEAHHNLRVLIGSGDGGKSPYFEEITLGMLTLVQPLTVYRSPDRTKLPRHETKSSLTKMSPDGTLHTEGAINVSMPGSGGTQLEATFWLPKILGTSKTPTAPATPTTSEPSGRILPLDKVVWGDAVDGLAAGLLLTSSPRVPLNSKLTYQTLVRNTSNKPISFMTRLLQYDGYETPTVDGKPTKGAKRGYPLDPLYSVTLAPGESVIVPAQNGRENLEIYVGEGGSSDSPSLATITPGHLKIVQPLTIYRSPDHGPLSRLFGTFMLSKVSPEGRVRTEGANRATGLGGGTGRIEGGQTLEAYIYLEVGTRNAEAERSAASAVWGKVDRGLQCGIRMLSDQRVFKTGDTLEAELLWRNVGNKKAHWVNPIPLDIVPIIRKASGSECMVDMGARFMFLPSASDYAPGEVRSLGILKVTLVAEGTPSPKSNKEPGHITLAPGTYLFSGSGGVSRNGDPCPRSGEVAFTVVGNTPRSQSQKADGVVWGTADKGMQCGIRLLNTTRTFRLGDTLDVETLWRNSSSAPIKTVAPSRDHLYPSVHDAAGHWHSIDFGGRVRLIPGYRTYAPGEVVSLGVTNIRLIAKNTPSSTNDAPPAQIALAPGSYKLIGSGGVSAAGGPSPKSGEITLTVVGDETSRSDVELSLRLPKGVTTFSKLSEARFEVVLHNLGKPTKVSWITPANFGFYGPDLFTNERVPKPIPYIHTVGGPYRGEDRQLASGETIVLGTIQIPREARATLDAFPRPGLTVSTDLIVPPRQFYAYEARFSLGITVPGKGEQKLSARLPFTVTP